MALTKGEVIQVVGKLVVKVGEDFDDPATPNEISKDEVMALVTTTLQNLMVEYAD